MGYFLFMQEQRRLRKGWMNKSNAELQRLCDPLWRALSKEEKDKYKSKKKQARRAELDKHVKERQEEDKLAKELDIRSLRLARDQFLVKKKSKKKIMLLGMETPSIALVAPERELHRVQAFLQKCERTNIGTLFVRKGIVGFTRYSKDGKMYRCLVLSCDKEKATVKYIDFGNEEEVDVENIYSLIGDLETLRPLCFKLKIPNVDWLKNSEKNKARVEKKLQQVENLFVQLDENGDPILFNDLERITFKKPEPKQEKNPIESPEGCVEAGIRKEFVGQEVKAVPGPEKMMDLNGNLAQPLAPEVSIVKPEVEKSENDALTDGDKTGQAASSSQTGGTEDKVVSEASGEVLITEELKTPIVPDEADIGADAGENNNLQDEVVVDPMEKLISLLPGVKLEMEESGLLTDATLDVLESLVAKLDCIQFQCLKTVVEGSLLKMATQSCSGAKLILAVLKRSSQAEKFQALEQLYQGEVLVKVLSRISGFQVMVWSLHICSEEEIIALISARADFINALAKAKYAQYYLAEFVRTFPQVSSGLLEEILGQYDVLKHSPNVDQFFTSLTNTEIGLNKVVGWISKGFSDILEDEIKAGYVLTVICGLNSQHSGHMETLWRSLVDQKMLLPVASSPVGCPLVVGMVEAVVSGRCGGEGLRSEVITDLAHNVDALCATPGGIKVLKCLE